MKKVKIMLLSLALFAVVGGALAFKAKFDDSFCTTTAYFTTTDLINPAIWTCSYSFVNGGVQTTTKTCLQALQNKIEVDPANPQVKPVCTTDEDPTNLCNNTSCPVQESVITD